MLLKIIVAVFISIISSLVGYGIYKYNQLTDIIAQKDQQIKELLAEEKMLNAELIVAKSNVDNLTVTITTQNEKISKLTIDNEANLKAFKEWKNKAENEKYKNSKLNSILTSLKAKTCEDGIKLNKEISTIRYQDL